MTRAGNSAFQHSLFLFPFKKVSDFIACGKNQRNKLKEAQHVFGADQKHKDFFSRVGRRGNKFILHSSCAKYKPGSAFHALPWWIQPESSQIPYHRPSGCEESELLASRIKYNKRAMWKTPFQSGTKTRYNVLIHQYS